MTHKEKHEEIKNLLDYLELVETLDKNKEIVRMYAAGMSAKPISNHFGISHERVYFILRRFKRKVRNYLRDHEN